MNRRSAHYFTCSEHRVKWYIGDNLFSSWRDESEEEQQAAWAKVASFLLVEPIYPVTEASDDTEAAPTGQSPSDAEIPF